VIAVIQRVSEASVKIEGRCISNIQTGLLVLLGVEKGDTPRDAEFLVKKIVELRIFNDSDRKMNRSLLDVQGALLVVSQFTLPADIRKGRRPSFNRSAEPDKGENLYNRFINIAKSMVADVQSGVFGAMMQLELVNDGPVTIIAQSPRADY
jgi:D-aminoacyl-tRNA deacylase